ncbi:MAG: SRPBCC family protein [Rhodoferax sp.]|nr:SRPBCC family protein [Rhodoferax sp.]
MCNQGQRRCNHGGPNIVHEETVSIQAQMLVRRPVAAVFEAIVDPAITTRFWFTRSTGRLEQNAQVRWDWDMFGVGDVLSVKAFDRNARIRMEWKDDPTIVEWRFEDRGGDTTLVTITNWGFRGTPDDVLRQAVDSKGGYTLVLAGLKAWLEHGIELQLVRDQFPDGCPG